MNIKNTKSVLIPLTILANGILDYTVFCELFDVDAFSSEIGFGNVMSLVVAIGVATIIALFSHLAAECDAEGKTTTKGMWVLFCALAMLAVSGIRLIYEATGTSQSIGGGTSGTSLATVAFTGLLMFMLLAEAGVSYSNTRESLQKEYGSLLAAQTRLEEDLGNIDALAQMSADAVNERMWMAAESVLAASETLYGIVLKRSGEMQGDFTRYVEAGEKAREQHRKDLVTSVEGLLVGGLAQSSSQEASPHRLGAQEGGTGSHSEGLGRARRTSLRSADESVSAA